MCRWSASREADFVDLFVERRERTPGVELLVRAKTNRVLGKDDTDKLFDKVRKSPAQGKRVVKRLSARIKANKQAARAVRPERQATVELRYLKVELPAKGKEHVEATIVHVREKAPRAERRFLLTTLPVESAADAERILTWYGLRWRRLFQGSEVRLPKNLRTGLPNVFRAPPPSSSPGAPVSDGNCPTCRPRSCSRTSNSGCWRSSPWRMAPPKSLGDAVFLVARLGGYFKRKPPGAEVERLRPTRRQGAFPGA